MLHIVVKKLRKNYSTFRNNSYSKIFLNCNFALLFQFLHSTHNTITSKYTLQMRNKNDKKRTTILTATTDIGMISKFRFATPRIRVSILFSK